MLCTESPRLCSFSSALRQRRAQDRQKMVEKSDCPDPLRQTRQFAACPPLLLELFPALVWQHLGVHNCHSDLIVDVRYHLHDLRLRGDMPQSKARAALFFLMDIQQSL